MKTLSIIAIAATILLTPALAPVILDASVFAAQKKKNSKKATSLSGKWGKVRHRLPRSQIECGKAVDEYIAASGHSAYASTPMWGFGATGFICSYALNRRTTAEAETLALRGCENGTKKWKHLTKNKCTIHASK